MEQFGKMIYLIRLNELINLQLLNCMQQQKIRIMQISLESF